MEWQTHVKDAILKCQLNKHLNCILNIVIILIIIIIKYEIEKWGLTLLVVWKGMAAWYHQPFNHKVTKRNK